MPALSACLIVRNEERHLARCLASIRGLADEVIVVDTGSTDRTIEIAREHGARVCGFTWQDDFSLARNFSIEQASGDWILVLDADESIAERDHPRIHAAIRQDAVHAFLVPQRHYLAARSAVVGWQPGDGGYEEGRPYPGYVDVDCRRLFQNRPWLRFRNRVHEALMSTDPERPLVEARGTWVIHHYGKLGDRELLRAKGEAYLRIGLKKVEDEPRNPQAHYELGVQYSELDHPEAALASYERALALSPGYRDALFRTALCHHRLRNYRQALAALERSARALPHEAAEIALAEGNVHRDMGDDAAAEAAFLRALAARPEFAPASINLALLRKRRARTLMTERRFDDARAALSMVGDVADGEVAALRGAAALGLGDVDAAITELQRSLEVGPTEEAALNLSLALEAKGEALGALGAAATALRVAPASTAALERFAQLSGRRPPSPRLRRTGESATTAGSFTVFFYQPHSVPFDGNTPRQRGLGGTESAIVYLAEALAQRGHRCVVFNNCEQPAHVGGVEYARWEELPVRAVTDGPDIAVGVRYWQLLGRARLAPLQIFWTGDAHDQPFLQDIRDPAQRAEIDLFMLQSDWQIETFRQHLGIPASHIVRTTLGTAASTEANGVRPPDTDRLRGSDPVRSRRLAYASTPFRGLDVLLDVFPRIRAACPDAELEIFSSMQVYGVSEADDRKQFDALYRKAEQPGVTLFGSLPQLELASRLQRARVLAYPNHYAETFCIAAAEAQAAGCAVVTSRLGALPETVGDAGICIDGDPRSAGYQEAFVDACVTLLSDDERWARVSGQARVQALARYSWSGIAQRWDAIFQAALTPEPPEVERVAAHLAAGRSGLAERMLARAARPTSVPFEAWDALQAFTAWCAGEEKAPPRERLPQVALYFRSLRRAGVLDI